MGRPASMPSPADTPPSTLPLQGSSVRNSIITMADGPIATGITRKVEEALKPVKLVVRDDSASHSGHAGVGGLKGGETHFAVEVISEAFEGVRRVQRQRLVYDLCRKNSMQ